VLCAQAEIVASLKLVQGKHEALSQQVALGAQRAAAIRGASVTELASSTCSPSRRASSAGKPTVSALDHHQQHRREAVSSSSLLRRSQGRSISWSEAGGELATKQGGTVCTACLLEALARG
jgi:hypothetical protein